MRSKNDYAVSAVVGVMLMLVVTIIIAAVVSAFAGGLSSGTNKAPQMTFSGKYSQTNGLTLMHDGGDALTTMYIQVRVRPSGQFSKSAENWVASIAKTNITDSSKVFTSNWSENVLSFGPGETAYVSAANMHCSVLQPQLWYYSTSTTVRGSCISDPSNIGKTMTIELYDSKSGKAIAKSDVIVQA